ncbi:hypothetical protein F5884DRAFT_834160 [Xylogone sp. PMI_703]|nr:hypothetical protein F5884DRAFT_834160 [Xylogone sp. PMI_703]
MVAAGLRSLPWLSLVLPLVARRAPSFATGSIELGRCPALGPKLLFPHPIIVPPFLPRPPANSTTAQRQLRTRFQRAPLQQRISSLGAPLLHPFAFFCVFAIQRLSRASCHPTLFTRYSTFCAAFASVLPLYRSSLFFPRGSPLFGSASLGALVVCGHDTTEQQQVHNKIGGSTPGVYPSLCFSSHWRRPAIATLTIRYLTSTSPSLSLHPLSLSTEKLRVARQCTPFPKTVELGSWTGTDNAHDFFGDNDDFFRVLLAGDTVHHEDHSQFLWEFVLFLATAAFLPITQFCEGPFFVFLKRFSAFVTDSVFVLFLLDHGITNPVGIATAGLALGKPDRASSIQSSSKRRKTVSGTNPLDVQGNVGENPSRSTRPGTSSNVITRDNSLSRPKGANPLPDAQPLRPTTANPLSPSTSRYDSPSGGSRRRLSVVRLGDMLSSTSENNGEAPQRRDSISSRGSWIRRLSIITLSQNTSPRSSMAQDSPSLTFSHGSRAPMIHSPRESSAAQLPPNKLVKRAPSSRNRSGTVVINQEPRPTFRRPATSHQRNATLQQYAEQSAAPLPDTATVPPPKQSKRQTPPSEVSPAPRTSWIPFFQSRPTKLTRERASGKPGDGASRKFLPTSRRVMIDEAARPTLLKPSMLSTVEEEEKTSYDEGSLPCEDEELDDEVEEGGDSNEDKQPSTAEISPLDEHQKRPRRSLSFHFSQPTTWISRSGSLRVEKRTVEGRNGGKRDSSTPNSMLPGRNALSSHGPKHHPPLEVMIFQDSTRVSTRPNYDDSLHSPYSPRSPTFHSRPRNLSSPLPPITRLSSFNVELARLGLPSPSSSGPQRSPSSPLPQGHARTSSVSSVGVISPTAASYFGSINSRPRTLDTTDRASTLIGSDSDNRGFIGDEDEMDLQSETVYGSIRTGAASSIRSYATPLESLFDDAPPSANSTAKSKRLSIHELVGGQFHEGNKIVEEDEDTSTPVKGPRSLEESFETPVRTKPDISINTDLNSTPKYFLSTKDYSGLSLDDDDDEDWTRDDENTDMMALSPPSNSLNFRRISPNLRMALADVTHTNATNGKPSERPKSNLFDWSEPSIMGKMDHLGHTPRPRTAQSNQVLDGRGGRAVGRKGPSALHIRSQSVPVVPDGIGHREHLTPKFGTWGLGAKGVSEDWDGDFEFDNSDSDSSDGKEKDMPNERKGSMVVPLAIQESQANVVGHVGQIREFCLLVEDLKRLRILGREKDLLDGESAHLWKEAEGIIALAVPDEEDQTLSAPRSPSAARYDYEGDEKLARGSLWDNEIPKPDISNVSYDTGTVRRRSVFSPEDDIFGTGAAAAAAALSPDTVSITDSLAVPASSRSSIKKSSTTEVARSVMEIMHQHRSASDPRLPELTSQSPNKMPFDTTSLRDLVHRAGVLTRTLGEIIRKFDGTPISPEPAPKRESSPAFTRVFADPMTLSPSRQQQIPRSQSNNSVLTGSIDASPGRLTQHIHMMAVG